MDRRLTRATASERRPGATWASWWVPLRRGWNAFFFSPADPTSLGLIRIAVGPAGVLEPAGLRAGPARLFRLDGWAEPAAIRAVAAAAGLVVLVPGARRVAAAGLVRLPGGPGALHARAVQPVTAVLAWVIVVSTVRRVPIALYGFDQVLSTLTLYLAVTGASGQAVSLDRFLRRWRQARAAARPAPSSRGRRRRAGASRPTSRRSRRRRSRPIWPCG